MAGRRLGKSSRLFVVVRLGTLREDMCRLLWVTSILAGALLGLAAQSTTTTSTTKKSTTKKSTHAVAAKGAHPAAVVSKKSTSTHTRSTISKNGKKAPARRVATR